MASNQIETEVKFKIDNPVKLEDKIKLAGGQLLHKDTFQRAVYFDTADKSLKQKGIALRVREGEKKVLTVKSKIANGNEDYKELEELEMEISDASLVRKMLTILGFSHESIMEKYRTEYSLADTVLALDQLPFGNFLEIEGNKEKIEEVINILGLQSGERLTVSYRRLFDDHKKDHNLTGDDIVFPLAR